MTHPRDDVVDQHVALLRAERALTRPSAELDAAHVAALSDLILVPTRPAILGTLERA